MDKAGSLLRRSRAVLLKFGSPHAELRSCINDLQDLKVAVKTLAVVQTRTFHQMERWSKSRSNQNKYEESSFRKETDIAVHDVFQHVSQIVNIWKESQEQIVRAISNMKHQFEMILEDEKKLETDKKNIQEANSELEKATDSGGSEKIEVALAKVESAEASMKLHNQELQCVKLIRIKDSVNKFYTAVAETSHKTNYLFQVNKELLNLIPDVHEFSNGGASSSDYKYQGRTFTVKKILDATHTMEAWSRLEGGSQNSGNSSFVMESSSSTLHSSSPINPLFSGGSTLRLLPNVNGDNSSGSDLMVPVLNSSFPPPYASLHVNTP